MKKLGKRIGKQGAATCCEKKKNRLCIDLDNFLGASEKIDLFVIAFNFTAISTFFNFNLLANDSFNFFLNK